MNFEREWKRKVKQDVNPNSVNWEHLDKAWAKVKVRERRPGPEWFSVSEYAVHITMSCPTAYDRIRRLVDAGYIEPHSNNHKCVTGWYRMKSEGH